MLANRYWALTGTHISGLMTVLGRKMCTLFNPRPVELAFLRVGVLQFVENLQILVIFIQVSQTYNIDGTIIKIKF